MNPSTIEMASEALPRFFLASRSPRRKQILENLGLSFQTVEMDTEEVTPSAQEIESTIQENAYRKALRAVVFADRSTDVIIAADTLVVMGTQVFGKPASDREALAMLNAFSGQQQTVVTGLVLFSHYYGVRRSTERTIITFRHLTPDQIEDYVQTREPYDKAGAYAVQGLGSLFIDKIEGSYTNVIGFPVELFLRELHALTKIPLFRWLR